MSEELKPCPFCGSDADTLHSDGLVSVRCGYCGTSGPSFPVGRNYLSDRGLAIAAWNRRAEETP